MSEHNRQPDHEPLPLEVEQEIDRISDEFERAWQSGQTPRIEDYLDRVPAVRRARLLRELLLVECDLRNDDAMPLDVSALRRRFPDQDLEIDAVIAKAEERRRPAIAETKSRHQSDNRPREPRGGSSSPPLEQVGRYVVQRELGAGGFGVVHLAHDPDLDRLVAIKIPHRVPELPQHREGFLREIRTAARLQSVHPLIVPVFDQGQLGDGRPFVVMEYVEGQSLDRLIASDRPSIARSAQILLQIAQILHAAHLKGFVHRDIKPGNVLIDRHDTPHLTDFGLAIHERDQHLFAGDASGTLVYRSPEQVRGEANWMDARCDIWALGVMLYELLTGRRPFMGATLGELNNEILHRTPKSPRTIDDKVPVALQKICMKCLQKAVEDRYTAADELAHELIDVVSDLQKRPADNTRELSALPIVTRGQTSGQLIDASTSATASVKRYFLSYLQGDADEEALAHYLHQELVRTGHECFIDAGMRAGMDWVQEVSRRLQSCECMVVLLSENAMHSEMVQSEVRLASALRQQTGRPYIVPVRVKYFGPLEYELDLHIGRLQHIKWFGSADSERVYQETVRAADAASSEGDLDQETLRWESKPDTDGPRPRVIVDPRSAAIPGGTIRASDRYYIRRDQDNEVVDCATGMGTTLVFKGPRQMGKSSLLMHFLSQCQKAGKRIAFVDLSELSHSDFVDYHTFLLKFSQVILHRLNMDPSQANDVDSQFSMIRFVENRLLLSSPSSLVIALDEADRIFGQSYQADFFSMLRVWHNNRSSFHSTAWENLDLVLAISTEPYLLIEEGDRSPFNVGLILELDPFTCRQCVELNERYSDVLSGTQVAELWRLLGGHPYLTRLAYYRLTSVNRMEFQELMESATADRGPFGDHLRALQFKLHEKPELLEAMRQVIRSGNVNDQDLYYRLYGAGLVRRDGTRINPANLLYARYFRTTL